MRRYPLPFAMLLALMMFAFSQQAGARPKNESSFDGAVNFGSQVIYVNDGCVAVDGTVASGDFFGDLKRSDVSGQFEFRKHGDVVVEYPESVTATIRLVGGQCDSKLTKPPMSVFPGDTYAFTFRLDWKDGMQMTPATFSPVTAHCTGASSTPIPQRDFTIPSVTCEMTVDSKGVPLGDHLVVSILKPDGALLTRISAQP